MYVSIHVRKRLLAAIGFAAILTPLAGCQNHKIVARINDTPINDEEYQDYVSRVKVTDFQQLTAQQIQTDAGGAGLISAVKDKLLEKLATEKKAMPSTDEVKRYQQYLTRTNPAVMSSIAAGQLTSEQLPKLLRDNIIHINLGTDNATVPEADIQKAFKDNQAQYNYPEIVGLRVAPVPSETEGIQVINQIKQTGDFASATAKYAPNAGAVRYITLDPLPPALKDALASLKDGQVASAPVKIQAPGSPTANTLVVQLVKRMAKGDATLADAHEAIRERKLAELQPQMIQHSEEVISKFNKEQKVEVYIDRYADIVKQAMNPPVNPAGMMGAPGGPGGPSGGPGAGRPMMMRPGAGAAPGSAPGASMSRPGATSTPSGGTSAPASGASAPSGAASAPASGASSANSGASSTGSGAAGNSGAATSASPTKPVR